MTAKNQATRLLEFIQKKGGVILLPEEKDYDEWWALLDKMKVPFIEVKGRGGRIYVVSDKGAVVLEQK